MGRYTGNNTDTATDSPLRVLTFRRDFKQNSWQEASQGGLMFVKTGRLLAVVRILLSPLLGRVDGVLYRYLNENKGLPRALLRTALDILIGLAAKARSKRVVWLVHNVDKESNDRHPKITKLRRRAIGRLSDHLLVTEEGLEELARKTIPYAHLKPISTCPFGAPYRSLQSDYGKHTKGEAQPDCFETGAFYFVSVNNWLPKKRREIDLTRRLLEAAKASHHDVRFIIGGPQVKSLRQQEPALLAQLAASPLVTLIDDWVDLEKLSRSGACQAIIKSYDDLSTPLAVLQAASINTPIVSDAGTFIGGLVTRHNIGIAVKEGAPDIDALIDGLRSLGPNPEPFSQFLAKNNWGQGAKAIIKAFSPGHSETKTRHPTYPQLPPER